MPSSKPVLSKGLSATRVREGLERAMADYATLYAVERITGGSYDDFTSAKSDITQSKDTGETVTVMRCRITHVRSHNELSGAYKGLVYVPKPGDMLLSVPLQHKDELERAFVLRDSYIIADGEKFSIQEVTTNRIEANTTVLVACRRA